MTHLLFGFIDIFQVNIPLPAALAAVATIGYLVSLQKRKQNDNSVASNTQRELRHARKVASELERITWSIRKNIARHQTSVTQFKNRINKIADNSQETSWKELCTEAEEMLKPTMRLATQISDAYDKIRQQSASLMSITESRTDHLTHVNNRRALDDTLRVQLAMASRYGSSFSVLMLDVDNFKTLNDEHGHLHGDRALQELAGIIVEYVREPDVVVRYGGDEFVVIMPQTDLYGASMLCDRLRMGIVEKMHIKVSGGVASAIEGDGEESLMARADAALYKAKLHGRNCIFKHDGKTAALVTSKRAVEV